MATGLAALVRDRAYLAALAAALPAVAVLAAATPLVWTPHWPGPGRALLLIGVAPVLEEIVFRAGLHDWLALRLRQSVGPISLANVLTALVFAFAHLWRHPPFWALAVMLPALVFGAFYERHRHLAAPIGLHAVYNAAYLLLLGV